LLVMSKQQQAPGDLEQLRAFVNTADLEEARDELSSPEKLGGWLAARGLGALGDGVTEADLQRAIELREALRSILLAHNDGSAPPSSAGEVLDSVACRARLQLRFDRLGGSTLQPEARGVDGALGRLLAIMHSAAAIGTWERLKACRDHGCEWAFYDHTKNRSGTWCNMAVCGNRAKARAYRDRRAQPEGSN
jgi:predicted RNA-binding Zn ribbon-like protein